MTTRHRVVLYNPRAVFYTMPLGVLAVASALDPARYEARIVDGRLETDPVGAVLRELDSALCLGISVLTGQPIRDAIAVARAARARHPDLPIVWGGWHPSLFGRECLAEPTVDVTVQGQGEVTFAELVERIAQGGGFDGCAGTTYRTPAGEVVTNAPRPLAPLTGFRPHDYTRLPVERFFALKGKRQIDYIGSQGCLFRCAFCADPFVYDRQWTGLPPPRIGQELDELWQRHRFSDVNFQDETFFTYPARVEAIADEFLSRGRPFTWAGTLRADQGDRLSEAVLAKVKRSGLRRVIVGVEAGSQEMLDRIKKDIKIEQVYRTADKCRRHNIAVRFPFIVGFPNESDASVAASLALARELRAMSPTFDTPIFYFKPYPGTPLTELAVRDGYRLPQTLDEWADFDIYGSGGPWVSDTRAQLVERYKFYQTFGYGHGRGWQRPLRRLARWRCERDYYRWPIEKSVSDWLAPPPPMS